MEFELFVLSKNGFARIKLTTILLKSFIKDLFLLSLMLVLFRLDKSFDYIVSQNQRALR